MKRELVLLKKITAYNFSEPVFKPYRLLRFFGKVRIENTKRRSPYRASEYGVCNDSEGYGIKYRAARYYARRKAADKKQMGSVLTAGHRSCLSEALRR